MFTSIRLFTAIAIVLLITCAGAAGQHAYEIGEKYLTLGLYEFAGSNDLRLHSSLSFNIGVPIKKSRLAFEWQRPWITVAKYDGNLEKPRVASTILVAGCMLAPVAWTMAAMGYEEEQITNAATYVMAPFGPHLAYRAHEQVTLYGGVIPDFILFSDADGMIFQNRAGIRIDSRVGLTFTAGVQQSYLWAFEGEGRSFEPGYFLGIAYSSPRGGALLD